MGQQSPGVDCSLKGYPLKGLGPWPLQPVVFCQTGIEHREVRIQELQGRGVAPQNFPEEGLRLPDHVPLERVIEVPVILRVDGHPVYSIQVKPLPAELLGKAIRPLVPEQTVEFALENPGSQQLSGISKG